MSEFDYEKLAKSLERLREQYAFLKSHRQTLSGNLKEAVEESVIQRFETCFDTLHKHLRRYLEDQGLTNVPSSPKPIFRLAHENNLIENLDDWIDGDESYVQTRIHTAHNDSMEKSQKALGKVGNFIRDTTIIFENMRKP